MNHLSRFQISLAVLVMLALSSVAFAGNGAALGIPDGTVLLGNPADSSLSLSGRGAELRIAPLGPARNGHLTYPALSRDGQWIATSYVKSLLPTQREGIAIYSVAARQWSVYGDYETLLAVSLSPDASQVAFRTAGSPSQLMLLNLRTGQTSVLDQAFSGGQASWSPEGDRLAYAVAIPGAQKNAVQYEIYVIDLATRTKKRIAEGSDPAWSPSGEWIAYLSNSGDCTLIRPDGTGSNVIVPRRGRWLPSAKGQLVFPPVWSPDSKRLLLNEDARNAAGRVHVHLFDLSAKTMEKKAGDSLAALGWSGSK